MQIGPEALILQGFWSLCVDTQNVLEPAGVQNKKPVGLWLFFDNHHHLHPADSVSEWDYIVIMFCLDEELHKKQPQL